MEIKLYTSPERDKLFLGRKYRILKSWDKKHILVIEHTEEAEPADVIREICGENNGKVYEVQGKEIYSIEATGKYGETIRGMAELVQEHISERGHF